MHTRLLLRMAAVVLVGLAAATDVLAQGKSGKKSGPKPLNEEKEILSQIKDAYKASSEVPKDVLKELRKSYQQPSANRETKILKELQRLYQMTPEQEDAILHAVRQAAQQPSAEQEDRLFAMLRGMERLPEGAVPSSVQMAKAQKMFPKLDRNGDGLLAADELPDSLRNDQARWDSNRDGFIDAGEYWAYYQGRLRALSEQVAAGQVDLGGRQGGPVLAPAPVVPEEEGRPPVYRAGHLPPGLPDWLVRLDRDGDGQVGLYEWKTAGRPLQEFFSMDRNDDGFLTLDEMLRYLAQHTRTSRPEGGSESLPGRR